MFGLADGESENGKYQYFLSIQPQSIAIDHNITNNLNSNYFSRPQYYRTEKEHFVLLNNNMEIILPIVFFWVITENDIRYYCAETAIPELKQYVNCKTFSKSSNKCLNTSTSTIYKHIFALYLHN